jgi:ABC-type lipoprotein release transport system permease subunit
LAPGWAWSARFVETLLFGVDGRDALTLAGTGAVLATIGLLAAWLPARRASRLNPTALLRS